MKTGEEIEATYGYHKGNEETIPKHQQVRSMFKALATALDNVAPDGRAKAMMHTHLEEASMWANKAVAELAPVVDE